MDTDSCRLPLPQVRGSKYAREVERYRGSASPEARGRRSSSPARGRGGGGRGRSPPGERWQLSPAAGQAGDRWDMSGDGGGA